MNLSTEGSARIGDSIGGITAPFVGVLAAVVTFLAFWVQYEYNKRQLRFTIKEQFDHAFYEMLSIHESITNALRLEVSESLVNSSGVNQVALNEKVGREVFAYIYEEMVVFENEAVGKFTYPNRKQYVGIKGLFQGKEDPYSIYESNKAISSLDHYFRQLYSLFKMIDASKDLDFDEKYNYASIIRSTLSQYDLFCYSITVYLITVGINSSL